jgi:hypothetical protein
MTEKKALNVRNFNDWIWDDAGEAGAEVEVTDTGFELVINEQVFVVATTLIELIEKIDATGLLGRGLIEALSKTFDF